MHLIKSSAAFERRRVLAAAVCRRLAAGCVALLLLLGAWQPLRADLVYFDDSIADPEDFSLLGSAWNPGPNAGRFGGNPAPGSATFSIMNGGLTNDPSADTTSHRFGFQNTQPITNLIPTSGYTVANYASMINTALNVWDAPSGFTNLGLVADGNVNAGAPQSSGGHLGDIRVAAWQINGLTILAHAFQPGTEAMFGAGGTVAGDVHVDPDWNWVDSATPGPGQFDLLTVLIHEIGHSLGLGHSGDPTSVMFSTYSGARRTLVADDIAGIRAIYGVPEPGTLVLLLTGGGIIGLWRHSSHRANRERRAPVAA